MKSNPASATSKHFSGTAYALMLFLIVASASGQIRERKEFRIENPKVQCSITIADGQIVSDRLELTKSWAREHDNRLGAGIETDADFEIDLMYTDWQAPGKANNADNEVVMTKQDFLLVDVQEETSADGARIVTFTLRGNETSMMARLTYRLEPTAFYVKRSLALLDTAFGHHFLRKIYPRKGEIRKISSLVKKGDFGQPVAMLVRGGGAFFGLEYPASENRLHSPGPGPAILSCSQEMGSIIGRRWVESDWVVAGITPDDHVKKWFFAYLESMRVAPVKPYTLYNSWYDLRSPEYPKVPKENFMGEQSSLRMIDLLKKNMIEKHGITLDAFVLDDGWDIYESDWALRKEQFPRGMKPLTTELKKTKTNLGIWFGPTGGYSFRKKRIGWMKSHGYEVVGDQMCVAGEKYGALLKKRVTDFVKNDGVAYFKWDGIQFSCSEPGHGHPVDVYSRRAVISRVAELCSAVREKNPDMFLNITSGTWLSPWWVKYANTIWMQGGDYGYADVPSISQRDAAITYRDFMLYDDFRTKDLWFPIANLMTHGIIKGKLELLGSPEEPLDKFTDDAFLYVARGVAMYELYISPDILTEGEWDALSASLTWARDRFPVLSSMTGMIGGNPQEREAYGYTHFKGNRGVIAARNPYIKPATLAVQFESANGFDGKATDLVLERVYPTRWISPSLYRGEDLVRLELDGYETAVYEVYPLAEAKEPLIAGVLFDAARSEQNRLTVAFHNGSSDACILNPDLVESVSSGGQTFAPGRYGFRVDKTPSVITDQEFKLSSASAGFTGRGKLSSAVTSARIAILLTPATGTDGEKKPGLTATLNGVPSAVTLEKQEGPSQWYFISADTGMFNLSVTIEPPAGTAAWSGTASAWIVATQRQVVSEATLSLKNAPPHRPLPPRPFKPGEMRRSVHLGTANITASVK